jgi:hypothetical protein
MEIGILCESDGDTERGSHAQAGQDRRQSAATLTGFDQTCRTRCGEWRKRPVPTPANSLATSRTARKGAHIVATFPAVNTPRPANRALREEILPQKTLVTRLGLFDQ